MSLVGLCTCSVKYTTFPFILYMVYTAGQHLLASLFLFQVDWGILNRGSIEGPIF